MLCLSCTNDTQIILSSKTALNQHQVETDPDRPAQNEDSAQVVTSEDRSYAKQHLLVKPSEFKLLGVKWDKLEGTIAVQFPSGVSASTKRGVLASKQRRSMTLSDKRPLLHCKENKFTASLRLQGIMGSMSSREPPNTLAKVLQLLPAEVTIPRPLVPHHQPVLYFELHVFGDASTYWVGAAVYHQLSGKKREPLKPRLQLKQD